MAYSEKLVQHFENPKNVGTISTDPNDKEVGTGLVGAPAEELQIHVLQRHVDHLGEEPGEVS